MTLMVEIKSSPVAGLGAFATQDIPSNTKLGDYTGVEMTLKEFKEQYGDDISYTYSLRFVNKILVGKDEPYRSQNISHYMNEGEQNCILKKRGVYTTRDIKKGEELFLTYPKRYIRTWL